ncbi:hypothetical protein [Rhizobium laguerreae]|uniref:hypothetical protein n=1 Tax=Rhizobium laguerreae TaxID=1076926 RepID=UPI00144112E9|nr:hypothetical protein [Rhizobium laguerreae]NKM69371.1 hypothetical protein [Rhizobium laguerreae]
MEPKLKCALATKPVLWSTNGYTGPCGPKVVGGFVSKYGYGAEEWNNDDDRVWKDYRVFHTETSGKLDAFAEFAHLGLIMTAMHGDVQYIVGIACGISYNTDAETSAIAKHLKLRSIGKEIWKQESVRANFKDRAAFDANWGTGQHTIRWKCPIQLYHWFDEPLALPKHPLREDKLVLAKMHGGYQAIRPEDGLKLLGDALPLDHPIREWLINNDFDEAFINPKDRKQSKPLTPKQRGERFSVPAAMSAYKRYLRERIINIDPAHAELERKFRTFLAREGMRDLEKNSKGIDAAFTCPTRGAIIAELKPTKDGETRFAVRMAVGQILEYRHFVRPEAKPLIVLGSPPSTDDLSFLRTLDIACGWPSDDKFDFAWV